MNHTDIATLPHATGVDRAAGLAHRIPAAFISLFRERRPARVLISFAAAVFAGLAVTAVYSEGSLLGIDTAVQQTVIEGRATWLDTSMIWLTFLGTRYAIGALVFGLVLWSLVTGRAHRLTAVVVLAVVLNPVFEVGFKEIVDRARPDLARLVQGNGPSFPSGHVLASVGFYGLVPLMAWELTQRAWVRMSALVGSLTVIGLVAFSRIYLDVHWTTDVVAGLLLGSVLLVAAYRAYDYRPRRLLAAAATRRPTA